MAQHTDPTLEAKALLNDALNWVQREEQRIRRAINALNGKSPGRPSRPTQRKKK